MSARFYKSFLIFTTLLPVLLISCSRSVSLEDSVLRELQSLGLPAEAISAEQFTLGTEPAGFRELAGAAYKPSYNQEPAIPAQCWIETGYGTQNACKYCHTDYLTEIGHGNSWPIAEDQVVYSFPTSGLNRILWQNIIYPENIRTRLAAEGIELPDPDDTDYVRTDNWSAAFRKGRGNGNLQWFNTGDPQNPYAFMPALNPAHLFPYHPDDPTGNGVHDYIDQEGFVRDETGGYTGWRAVNFFPYAIFTPLSGSVSGIYIRLPEKFMTENGRFSRDIYTSNLDILEHNIKNMALQHQYYLGDASPVAVKKGFYPEGTEFAHPLHYVDLRADGEAGIDPDGVINTAGATYEFPGTRSKRVKEIRYMYKWKDVGLEDIAMLEDEEAPPIEEFAAFYGREGQGWVDNGAGWILAAFIENRHGELRPQTTEELNQCIGCHANVGNTVDAVWSFQRRLPGNEGWADMHYGHYNSKQPEMTRLADYMNAEARMGEQAYFYFSVLGADLYGVMPDEIREELMRYATPATVSELKLAYSVEEILNDEILKKMERQEREPRLLERQKLMRRYSNRLGYLTYDTASDRYCIKGSIYYPSEATMKANIYAYRTIVLDRVLTWAKIPLARFRSMSHLPSGRMVPLRMNRTG